MRRLFHTRADGGGAHAKAQPRRAAKAVQTGRVSVQGLIERGARRLRQGRVYFGHGTDNAWDESAALVLHALGLPHDAGPAVYAKRVGVSEQRRAEELISRRVRERVPAVYLTRRTWFAGLSFHVDPRVLIPRSPLAELIERRFAPWIDAARVERILDVGTGSGCIAVACAKAFPQAQVDAVDISPDALEVAQVNVRSHRVGRRVHLIESDHYRALKGRTYDIIVANPPYVGAREMKSLPPEYHHEPRLALAAGPSGLDSIRVILGEARQHLRPGGLLVVEAGNTQSAVQRAFPRLPFLWLSFERGGGGVFLLTAEQLLP
jgi:ribosomal protein L3 glutamine methyltransferase